MAVLNVHNASPETNRYGQTPVCSIPDGSLPQGPLWSSVGAKLSQQARRVGLIPCADIGPVRLQHQLVLLGLVALQGGQQQLDLGV